MWRRLAPAVVALVIAVAAIPARGQQLAFLDRNIKDLETWAREDTNDSQRAYFLALAHWKHHHWRQTDSLLRLAIVLEPRYADAYLALYYLPYARKPELLDQELRDRVPDASKPAVEEARRFYQRAFRTDPMVNLNVMGIAFDIQEPKVMDYTASEYLDYLRCCAWFVDLGLGRYRSARERLQTLAKREFDEEKHPDRVPDFIFWFRGLASAHTMQYDDAIADFRVLLERSLKQQQKEEIVNVPLRDNEYRFMLAALHHMAGHSDSAIALYQEALEHDLGLVMAHTYMASLYEKSGRAQDAMTERRRAAEVSSDDPTAQFDLAVSLFNWGLEAQAEEPLRQAITLNARYAPPYYLLGRVLESLGKPAEAREQFTRFLSLSSLSLGDLRTDAEDRLTKLPK